MYRAACCVQRKQPFKFVPLFLGHFEQRLPGLHAGIIDEEIETAEGADDSLEHRLDLATGANVSLHGQYVGLQGANLRNSCIHHWGWIVVVVHCNAVAIPGQLKGNFLPDSAAGSRYQSCLARLHVHLNQEKWIA
jgi:hypothetical protein